MIPKIITTTQIQRDPTLLQLKGSSGYTVITKNGKPISVLISPELFEEVFENQAVVKSKRISEKTQKYLKKIDSKKFQEKIRDEY